jgi:serine/threonine protein kinase
VQIYVSASQPFSKFRFSFVSDKVDLWGAGIVLVEMLTNFHPFEIENAVECVKAIKDGQRVIEDLLQTEKAEHLSKDAKDLILSLFRHNPSERWSAAYALESKWIKSERLQLKMIKTLSGHASQPYSAHNSNPNSMLE